MDRYGQWLRPLLKSYENLEKADRKLQDKAKEWEDRQKELQLSETDEELQSQATDIAIERLADVSFPAEAINDIYLEPSDVILSQMEEFGIVVKQASGTTFEHEVYGGGVVRLIEWMAESYHGVLEEISSILSYGLFENEMRNDYLDTDILIDEAKRNLDMFERRIDNIIRWTSQEVRFVDDMINEVDNNLNRTIDGLKAIRDGIVDDYVAQIEQAILREYDN